jgi:hypothetical protein
LCRKSAGLQLGIEERADQTEHSNHCQCCGNTMPPPPAQATIPPWTASRAQWAMVLPGVKVVQQGLHAGVALLGRFTLQSAAPVRRTMASKSPRKVLLSGANLVVREDDIFAVIG